MRSQLTVVYGGDMRGIGLWEDFKADSKEFLCVHRSLYFEVLLHFEVFLNFDISTINVNQNCSFTQCPI